MSVRVVKPGVYSTVQDLGRPGHGAQGVPAGGAADRLAHMLANRVVGNADSAATIETTLVGATLLFERGATIALAGATPAGVPLHRAIDVPAGATLALGPLTGGARCYLAVAGGFDVPLVLGSRSTHAASGLGGHEGRPLRALDVLTIGHAPTAARGQLRREAVAGVHGASHRRTLRVVAGPQARGLGPALESLLTSAFTVSARCDRVGLRLDGPVLGVDLVRSGEMVTEPVAAGAIQVPQDGSPIVLGPDAPVTGGYPVIASVIAADLPALGQLGPRDGVRFELVTLADAAGAVGEQRSLLDAAAVSANNNRA